MRDLITEKIKKKISKLGNDTVFIANDFIEIAEYETARKTLNRFVKEGGVFKKSFGVCTIILDTANF